MLAVQISTALALVFAAFAALHHLHMLQLNSYFPGRYLRWLKGEVRPHAVLTPLIPAAAAILCVCGIWQVGAPVLALWGAAAGILAVRRVRRAKKPLVFTGRIIRMYVTLGIFAAAVLLVSFLIASQLLSAILLLLSALLWLCPPIAILLLNTVNQPMEALLRGYYIRDARRILRGLPDLTVIGVTGSYGKTGVKHMLGRILSEKYNVLITPGSFNTPLGVVRTIREQLRPGTQIFVCEMGAKKRGDVREICGLVHPSLGVITAIGPQHLDTFGSIENIAATKFELADAVCGAGGRIFLNAENSYIRAKAEEYNGVCYGVQGSAAWAEDVRMGRNGSTFALCTPGGRTEVTISLLGKHNLINFLGSAAAALSLGVPLEGVRFAASQLQPVEHRLQLKPFFSASLLIDDAYNANPDGSLEAVRVLGMFGGYHKIIVTPGLVELGEEERGANQKLALAAAEICDEIYLVGDQRAAPMIEAIRGTAFPQDRVRVFAAFQDALAHLRGVCDAKTVVLFENDLPDNYAK